VDVESIRPALIKAGSKLDRYEMLCPIAEGGMASVWIARLTGGHGFEKLVAIKTILPKYAADARFQLMFVEEARIASRIEHVNVAQILDVGEKDQITYLVMEYVDGDSLATMHRTLQKEGTLVPPGVVLRVMADVCGGLHAAHELRNAEGSLLRVVHRDVSPQNVLVSVRGVAKLIDFGIAKARTRTADDTNTGPIKGKIRYMAPEQARGDPVDRRADVWAVGAVLYHLLSGRSPYDGNDLETLATVRAGKAPEALPSTIHPAVASVVMRALSPLPENRFAMVTELQRSIENAMVEAQLETTAAGVAAFVAEHVAEGGRRRKAIIAEGLRALADRESSPAVEVEGTPARTGSVPALKTGSTIRPAAVEVAPDPEPRGRTWMFPVTVAVMVVAVAGLAVLAMSQSRASAKTAARLDLPPVPQAPSAMESAAPSPAPPTSAGHTDVPTVDVSQLPIASAMGSALPLPAALPARAIAPARVPPAAASKPTTRVRIDDGF
jgi:eukaryotic-like serine/threonine-protein kinase